MPLRVAKKKPVELKWNDLDKVFIGENVKTKIF